MNESFLLLALLLAFLIAIAGTPLICWLALRYHWLDLPNHRSSHVQPTPRLGGLVIIAATIVGIAGSSRSFEWWMLGIGLGAIFVAVTGLLDDMWPLSPPLKFMPQIGAAVVAVLLLEPRILVELPFVEAVVPSLVSAALAVVWIVSVINAVNFLDGLDGLATGVALVTAIALAGMLPGSAPMLIPFAGALAGFLLWNFEPASIFMGDVGSQFVGYLLATAVLMPGPSDTGAIPALFVFIPLLADATMTVFRRLATGKSPFSADRNHVFHRIVDNGASHRAVAVLYIGLTALASLGGFAYIHTEAFGRGMLIVTALVAGVVMLARIERVRMPARWQKPRSRPARLAGSTKVTNFDARN